MISANYNGMDAPQGTKTFGFIDWNFEIPFGKKGGWLTVGKQKEGVGHEYVAPGTQLMFMERGSGVPAFVRQRNIGIRYSNSILQQRATYTIGFFNNYWETGKSFSDNGSQVTARVTGLPMYTSDKELLHLGVGYRYSGSIDGKLSYKAKPETNTAPNYLNTGSFDASYSNTLMLEAIKVNGPVSFIGEYMTNLVKSASAGNPSFSYWQVSGGWFITGENRNYNHSNGNLGKLIPKKNFRFKKGGGSGAFEVAARYTHSDFSSNMVMGGEFGRFTTAASWYPNAHFRFSVNYGFGKLEKSDLVGKANFWQFRAQFEL
jgi:phosphate-selective porin OprO/OprP